MAERRETRKRWVQRGEYAVQVEVEVVYPADDPSEACLGRPRYTGWTKLPAGPSKAISAIFALWDESFGLSLKLHQQVSQPSEDNKASVLRQRLLAKCSAVRRTASYRRGIVPVAPMPIISLFSSASASIQSCM